MFLDMTYCYKGSSNIRLELRQVGDYIDLITDYGEKITSLQTGYGLMCLLEDLINDKYA